MAKIPLPERGQPLDVEYLYTIATAINSLATQVASATNKYTTITTPDSGRKDVRTGDARIVGGYATLAGTQNVAANSIVPFSFSLGEGFKYAPVVTATPVNRGGNSDEIDASVVINSITTQSVNGHVYFGTGGSLNIDVNILAVGIPT